MNLKKLGQPLTNAELWMSGKTVRYHNAPTIKQQTVGEHAWGVAVMCRILFPKEFGELALFLLLHDAPENVLGDTPYPGKKLMDVYAREAELEHMLMGDWVGMSLSEKQNLIFKVCDIVELILQTAYEVGLGNHHILPIYKNGLRVLGQLLIKLEDMCPEYRAVAVNAQVERMIKGIRVDFQDRMLGGDDVIDKPQVTEK